MVHMGWYFQWNLSTNNYGYSNCIYSDASLNGFGVTFDLDWIARFFNVDVVPTDIHTIIPNHHWCNVLELIHILIAARCFGHMGANCHILCFSDNTQVVAASNKGGSANSVSMIILRELSCLIFI